MSGIYKIINIINEKTYVGSTISKFNRRWNCHKCQLRNHNHGNKYLQNAWNKYGEDKFIFEIIEEIEGYKRGYFSGIFGYFDGNNLYSAVSIRFIEKTESGLLYKSGGGITADSTAASEYQELIDKIYIP